MGVAVARVTFGSDSLRGRYSGNIAIAENIPTDGTPLHIEARQLLALTFDGVSQVSGVSSVTVAVPGQSTFTCTYRAIGTFQLGDDGLGTASLALTSPTVQNCGDGITLALSLLVGGHSRERLDVTIDSADVAGTGAVPLVGSGLLEK